MPAPLAAFRSKPTSQGAYPLAILQASRLLKQVRCQDDRGSYPRPVPELYRLAQKLFAAIRDSTCAALEVPPSGQASLHPPCHRYAPR